MDSDKRKIKKRYILQLLCLLTFVFCKNETSENSFIKSNDEKTPAIIIDLQPFSDIPKKYVDNVYAELKKIYPNVTIKKKFHYHKQLIMKKGNVIKPIL